MAKYGPQGTSADHFGHSGEFRKLHLWKSDYQIERFDFQGIKSSKDVLYNWLNGKKSTKRKKEENREFLNIFSFVPKRVGNH